jgi:hypothetical protein
LAFLGPGAGAAALPLAFAPLVTVAGFVLGQGLVFLREKDLAFLSASASRDPLMLSFFFIGARGSGAIIFLIDASFWRFSSFFLRASSSFLGLFFLQFSVISSKSALGCKSERK